MSHLFFAATLVALVSCVRQQVPVTVSTGKETSKWSLETRLKPEWLTAASRIVSGDYHIFYQGEATGNYSVDGKHWVGAVSGDILLLTRETATVVPQGTVEIRPNNNLHLKSRASTTLGDPARWQPLLRS